MDLSLLFLHRQGLAGQPRYAGSPDLPFAGLQSAARVASQRCPILRWNKWGCSLEFNCASMGVFPVSVSLGVYRCGKGNGW
jgi:hypothetical protein